MAEKKCEDENLNEIKSIFEENPMIMILAVKACMAKIEEFDKKFINLEKDIFELKTILKYHSDFKK